MGGVARRATLIKNIRAELSGPSIVVDSGDTLMGDALSLRSDGAVVVEALNRMAYDAVGVGTGEVLKGPKVLQALAEQAQFAILSCNLVSSESGEPVMQPYVIVERAGLRVGIIGVSPADLLSGLETIWSGANVLAPEETLARYVEEVRPQVDLVVVLSQLGYDADTTLAEAVPGIDVIVSGRSHQLLGEPGTVGGTTIIQVGYEGEWLGRLDLAQAGDGYAIQAYQVLYMRDDVRSDADMSALIKDYYERYPADE